MKLALAVVLCAAGCAATGCRRPDEHGQALWFCDLGDDQVWVERAVYYEQSVDLMVSCVEGAPPMPCDLIPLEAASPAVQDGTVTLILKRCQTDLACVLKRLNVVGENFDTVAITADIPPPMDELAGFVHLKSLKFEGIYGDTLPKTVPVSNLYSFQNLTSFSMTKGQFSFPPEGFAQPSPLTELALTNGGLTYLPPRVFQGLHKLKKLDLSENKLWNITEEALQGLSSLEQFRVSGSGLHRLCDLTQVTPQLRTLAADHNQLQAVPTVTGLQHLKTIMLGSNQITSLAPYAFADLPALRELYIANNKIRALPSTVFRNSDNINTLYFLENEIEELPAEVFKGLSKLEYLQLNANRLRTLPPGIFQDCSSLEQVSVSHNQLTHLSPEVFKPLTALKTLNLQNNELEELPDNLFEEQSKLIHLRLSHNKLRRVAPLALDGAYKLEDLDLSNNQLTTVYNEQGQSTPYDRLKRLRDLDLSNNQLQDAFPEDSTLAQVADLSKNKV